MPEARRPKGVYALADEHRRRRNRFKHQKLKAKQLSTRMKARVRRRRARRVAIYETPVSMRSRFAWVTIVLMVLVIVAACIRVHPMHYRVEYAMTETGENPYMGTLDAEDGYLVSAELTWAELEVEPDTYEWPDDLYALEDGKRYVFVLDADAHPAHVDAEAASQDDPAGYIDEQLRRFVQALMEYMDQRGDCAYLQTDAQLEGMDARWGDVYLLCLDTADGLYRAPDGVESSWLDTPVAGSGKHIFGNHLTYVLDGGDGEVLAGRVGYALGVRYAEWHSFTRRGNRLFVNLELDNAGVTRLYQPLELMLMLRRGDSVCACEAQAVDLTELGGEPVDLGGYIDIPYDMEPGMYQLCVAVCESGTLEPVMNLTMPGGEDGYYALGYVQVR